MGELEASLVGSCDRSGVELPVGVKVEGSYELDSIDDNKLGRLISWILPLAWPKSCVSWA